MWGVTERILYVPLPRDTPARARWVSRHELVIEISEDLSRVSRYAAVLRARQAARSDRPPAGHGKTRSGPFLLLPGTILARRLAAIAKSGWKIHTAMAAAATTGAVATVAIATTPPHPAHHHHHRPGAAAGTPPPAATPSGHRAIPAADTHGSRSLRHRPAPSTGPAITGPSPQPPPSPAGLLPGLLPSPVPLPSLPAPLGGLLPTSLPLPTGKTAISATRHLLRALAGG